jgi:hypothetical protein
MLKKWIAKYSYTYTKGEEDYLQTFKATESSNGARPATQKERSELGVYHEQVCEQITERSELLNSRSQQLYGHPVEEDKIKTLKEIFDALAAHVEKQQRIWKPKS